jgi:glycosyltransferase involved in cell wall biosynthesis
MKAMEIEYIVIDGEPLTKEVEVGTFLDINSTLHYKATQLQRIAAMFHRKEIYNGDVFLVADIEFWGIESIRYLADLNGINVKLCGFCHAESYTREDFMGKCSSYAQWFERAWFNVFDKIFVGSQYHKIQMIQKRQVNPCKVIVTGNPYRVKDLRLKFSNVEKINRVILTNRPDDEKRPEVSLMVMAALKRHHSDWQFIVTTSRKTWGKSALREFVLFLADQGIVVLREGLSKDEYLQLLAESRVMISNSIEENFGYCVLEAMAVNTIPIVPNAYSYPELISDPRCLFNSLGEQLLLVKGAIEKPFDVWGYVMKYDDSLKAILKETITA